MPGTAAPSTNTYDAVGARVRSVPFLPGKVLAAIWRGRGDRMATALGVC